MPGTFWFMNFAIPADFRGMMPAMMGTLICALSTASRNRFRLSSSKMPWVWIKEMATHSRVLAWRIPGTAEPAGLPSMGSHRVGHD